MLKFYGYRIKSTKKITQEESAVREKTRMSDDELNCMKSLACVKLHQITFFFDLFLDLFGVGNFGFSAGEFTGDFGILFFAREICDDTISDSDLLTDGELCDETSGQDILHNCLPTVVTSFTPVPCKPSLS